MPEPSTPAGFLAQLLGAGMSTTAALGAFREAGGSIRTATWYQMAGEVKTALNARDVTAAFDPTSIPNVDMLIPWSAGKPGQYLYNFDIIVTNPEADLAYRVPFSFTTTNLFSPDDIMNAGLDSYSAAADSYGEVVHGAVFTGVYAMGQ